MHPRLAELIAYIDTQTAELHAAYEAVPADQRTTRPADNRWSAVEVVHHVALVERRIAMRVRGLIEQARGVGQETDDSSVLALLKPDRIVARTQRIVTGEATE